MSCNIEIGPPATPRQEAQSLIKLSREIAQRKRRLAAITLLKQRAERDPVIEAIVVVLGL